MTNRQLLRLKQRSNGDVCKITLENATALGAGEGFTGAVKIKRL